MTFSDWLHQQSNRDDQIGLLARCAAINSDGIAVDFLPHILDVLHQAVSEFELVPSVGLEPTTPWFEAKCSIH